jgi:hypothetical protein
MRQDIIKQLDGYDKVLREIETSRKYSGDITTDKGSAAAYIRRLHPAVIDLKISRIITETPSTKTLRLIPTNQNLPPFQAGNILRCILKLTASGPDGLTASHQRPIRPAIMTLPSVE